VSFELLNLFAQIAYNSINLFDHCFVQNFYLGADLNRSYCPAPHIEVWIDAGKRPRYNFAKRAVASPRRNSVPPVRQILN